MPSVWRELEVPATWTFESFHKVIQAAFGWYNSHLWEFSPKVRRIISGDEIHISIPMRDDWFHMEGITDADETKLNEFFPKLKKFVYTYDFGDNWKHDISLLGVIDENRCKAVCTNGKGQCPPEDCGGCWGYEDMKRALATGGEDAEYYREWLGFDENEDWDPDYFDLEETNMQVSHVLG